ncbi:MAG: hypothetical protein HC904_07920 [Blastochloris sp.]|nr:hypothetical protein [Blastochloris sp.]
MVLGLLFSQVSHGQEAAADATETAAPAEVAEKVELETVRRLEKSLLQNKQLDEGDKLFAAGDLKSARERYKGVMEATMDDIAFLQANLVATKGVAKVAAAQGAQAEREKNFQLARNFYEEALSLQPNNLGYQAALDRVRGQSKTLQEKYPGNSAVTPELENKVNSIQKLMFEGDAFVETGQYKRAIGRYQQVLLIDQYNDNARKRIEKVNKLIYQAASERRKVTKERALGDTERQWQTKPVDRAKTAQVRTENQTQSSSALLLQKLESIIIPEIKFTEVDIEDAVDFLRTQSVALDTEETDPDKKGVNIILKPEATISPTAATAEGAPAAAPVSRTLTINLSKVPLLSVLDFIKSLTGLQYKVEEHGVFLFPITESSDVMTVRSYSVSPTFFPPTVRLSPTTTGDLTSRTVEIATVPVQKELESKGIKFTSGARQLICPRRPNWWCITLWSN